MEPSQDSYTSSDLYVSDPIMQKEALTSYVTYTLNGKILSAPLVRRYSDFDCFRKKLLERWPGVFIPNLPHKQIVGGKEKEAIEMRLEMINRFLLKISKLVHLFNSDELTVFKENVPDVQKSLNSMVAQSYSDLLIKYHKCFHDYNENFDVSTAKNNLSKFHQLLKTSYPKVKDFRDLVKAERDGFQGKKDRLKLVIESISLFEKDTLVTMCNNAEDKLVFANNSNNQLIKSISDTMENYKNPFEKLYESVSEDYLDVEAMIDAFNSLNALQEAYEKLTKNFATCSAQLTDLQSGKSNIKSVFSFKSRDQDIDALIKEKDTLEKNIESLGQIIKIATFNMENEVSKFRTVSLELYYKELIVLQKVSKSNYHYLSNLWCALSQNPNLQAF